MNKLTRRNFLRLTGTAVATGTLLSSSARAQTTNKNNAAQHARVIVIGGGFGGAVCAKYLKLAEPNLSVTLIEPDKRFITCPFSNHVIANFRSIKTITHDYDTLRKKFHIQVVHDLAVKIDPVKRKVALKNGKWLAYDRLVMSPGIDLKWGAIRKYDPVSAAAMPHAWKAGAQTLLLRKKLEQMKNGGTFIITSPPNPFRCPPGPYERASLVAHYFKRYKPKSKIIILDAKDDFPKRYLFMDGWEKLYPGMIEWIPSTKGGTVTAINTKKMVVETEIGVEHRGDVINVIPPQIAGRIAVAAGLTDDKGWCPVDPTTFASKKYKDISVIGDASIADEMPKSGFAANSQAKITASAIVAELRGQSPTEASYVNTCYSLLAPEYGISVVGVYRATAEGIKPIPNSGGVSPRDADANFRAEEAKYALGWYASITADTWG